VAGSEEHPAHLNDVIATRTEHIKKKKKDMDEQRINQVLMAYADKLPPMSIESLKSRILFSHLDENSLQILLMQMKDPTISLILSILTGSVGVDRFYIGDIGMGIGKLLTGGGCGIWWLIDIFLIMDATRQKNLEMLMMRLA
jgi:hypothetical protein